MQCRYALQYVRCMALHVAQAMAVMCVLGNLHFVCKASQHLGGLWREPVPVHTQTHAHAYHYNCNRMQAGPAHSVHTWTHAQMYNVTVRKLHQPTPHTHKTILRPRGRLQRSAVRTACGAVHTVCTHSAFVCTHEKGPPGCASCSDGTRSMTNGSAFSGFHTDRNCVTNNNKDAQHVMQAETAR